MQTLLNSNFTGETAWSTREVSRGSLRSFPRFELRRDQHLAIAQRVRAAGRHYMASVWDPELLSWIDPYITIHKVGSGDLTCYPMLEALATTGKPIILSTGLATLDEVRGAVNFIAAQDRRYLTDQKLALLQCTSAYPTPAEAVEFAGDHFTCRDIQSSRRILGSHVRVRGDRACLCAWCSHYREALHR